jgi:hypothetical protein
MVSVTTTILFCFEWRWALYQERLVGELGDGDAGGSRDGTRLGHPDDFVLSELELLDELCPLSDETTSAKATTPISGGKEGWR